MREVSGQTQDALIMYLFKSADMHTFGFIDTKNTDIHIGISVGGNFRGRNAVVRPGFGLK